MQEKAISVDPAHLSDHEIRQESKSALAITAPWLLRSRYAFLAASAVLLIPCFWHQHIEACDLGSHIYIAWLTQAVSQGYLPGLHLVHQHTNAFFDLLLSGLFPYFGPTGTERVAVGFCVLIFFWGGFAFASAAARRPAWTVAPLLAMFTYGVIFHWGFFNCYLSVGLSLLALALVVGGTGKDFIAIPPLLALAAFAHPLGAACFVALALYLAGLRWLPANYHLAHSLAILAFSFAVRVYLVRHLEVLPRETNKFWLLGADQLLVFGREYFWLALATFSLCVLAAVLALRKRQFSTIAPWLYFYLTIALVIGFLPGGFNSPHSFGMMGYLPDRGSLYSAIALAALIACCRPGRWFPIACSVLGLLFFAAIYRDTGTLQRRETKVAELVRSHPGARVFSYYPTIPHWRIHEQHDVARACVGVCYDYTDYEPSSMQFRLQADDENRIVQVDQDALDAMQDGSYIVQPRDLPLFEVYQCGPNVTGLCIAALRAGQKTGDVPGITAAP
jgi:hypothetical protein